jgi:hypothetical protein
MLALICASLTLSKCAFYCGRRLERYGRRRASCPGRLRNDWMGAAAADEPQAPRAPLLRMVS